MTSRINPVDPAVAEGRTQELFAAVKAKTGGVPNMMKTMAHAPALLEGYLAFSGALSKGLLRPAVREQLALAVSQANGCEYCLSAHSLLGKRAGLAPEQIAAARKGEADDAQAQAALSLAHELIERRGDVSDEQLEAARLAGLSDGEIAEVVGHVALSTLTNYFNELARPELDFPRAPVSV
ncbi:MAG TPA: carboxymuconolactone decarboxylase family protein [Pirellulales bacterium]|nr:carboxymuconolactone decarboxylase family protein [Pirellulales bacterium]